MNMDEQNQSTVTDAPEDIALTSGPNHQQSQRKDSEPHIHEALASLNDKMGKLTGILEQIYGQSDETDEPLQGERPTGRKRTSVVSDADHSSDSDASTNRSRGKRLRRDETDDSVSIYAGDSAEEEADLRALTSNSQGKKTKGKKGRENNTATKPPNSAFLDELAKAFSDDDEATSPEITSTLADIALKRWGKKLNPDKLKSILDKYKRPANCASMTGKICNPEIWSQLNSTKKRNDVHLQNVQQTVLKATFAILQTSNAIATNNPGADNLNLIAQLVDAVALLSHAHTQLSQLRKDQIKPAIKQEYSAICSAEVQPDSNLLFGNDLAKTLKDAKETSSISSLMKSYSNKPYSNIKKPAYPNKNASSFKRPQRDFLWRNQKNSHNKKKSWSQGRTNDPK